MQKTRTIVTWRGVNKIHSGVAVAKSGEHIKVETRPGMFIIVNVSSILSVEQKAYFSFPETAGGNPGD